MLNKISIPIANALNPTYERKFLEPVNTGIYQISTIKPLNPKKYNKNIASKGIKIHFKLTLFK